MVRAELSPKNTTLRRNITCPARLDAEIEVWSTRPSITTSAILTADVIRFCITIGITRIKSSLKKPGLLEIIFFIHVL
jgi:hypothetical protein